MIAMSPSEQIKALTLIVHSLMGRVAILERTPRPSKPTPARMPASPYAEAIVLDAVAVAARESGIAERFILSRDARRPVSAARQRAMVIANKKGVTPDDISIVLNRDRSTVIEGIAAEHARMAAK